jgi:hypothetical protein
VLFCVRLLSTRTVAGRRSRSTRSGGERVSSIVRRRQHKPRRTSGCTPTPRLGAGSSAPFGAATSRRGSRNGPKSSPRLGRARVPLGSDNLQGRRE